jgi:hypothetical protein
LGVLYVYNYLVYIVFHSNYEYGNTVFLRWKHCVSVLETLCYHVDDRKNHVHFSANVQCFYCGTNHAVHVCFL